MIEIPTLVELETRETLFNLIKDDVDDNLVIVEVGVFLGGSICDLAQRLKSINVEPMMYAVDNWKFENISQQSKEMFDVGDDYLQQFLDNLFICGVQNFVREEISDSLQGAKLFLEDEIDLLFLDDDHSYPRCREVLEAWLPKVRRGGIIAGHDFSDPGVARAVHEVLGDVNAISGGAAYWKRVE